MRKLDNRLMKYINLLVERYPSLDFVKDDIVAAYLLMEEAYETAANCLWLETEVQQQMRSISLEN